MLNALFEIGKMGFLRVISPFVAGSNPALGTLMDFLDKPAMLLLPLPEELEIVHVADIFKYIFDLCVGGSNQEKRGKVVKTCSFLLLFFDWAVQVQNQFFF